MEKFITITFDMYIAEKLSTMEELIIKAILEGKIVPYSFPSARH